MRHRSHRGSRQNVPAASPTLKGREGFRFLRNRGRRCVAATLAVLWIGAAAASDLETAPDPFELALVLAEDLAKRGPEFETAPSRLARALETVARAQAWPATWLVLQDLSRDDDLVLHLRLAESGEGVEIDEAVLAARREEWDHGAVRDAVRTATGRKPRHKVRNVVIQGFRERTEHLFVYADLRARRDRGLLSLLPRDAIVRDSRRIEAGPDGATTLALAVIGPVFLPSDCACGDASFGHADGGRVLAVLAGKDGILAKLDLTQWLGTDGVEGRLPRFACEPGDRAGADPDAVREWFGQRAPIPLLESTVEGDGAGDRTIAIRLPVEREGCSMPGPLLVVDPVTRELRVRPETGR